MSEKKQRAGKKISARSRWPADGLNEWLMRTCGVHPLLYTVVAKGLGLHRGHFGRCLMHCGFVGMFSFCRCRLVLFVDALSAAKRAGVPALGQPLEHC